MTVKPRSLLVLLLALAPLAMGEGLPDLGDTSQADLSPQQERRIGEQLLRDVRRDPAYLDDVEVETYLNRLVGRLSAASPDVRQDFSVFCVRDATLNAFAWPGAVIGVHSGLILAAQSESELAGVLGHEMAHVTQRHIARQVSKAGQTGVLQLASLLIAVLAARSNSQVSEAVIVGSQAASLQAQLSYTRDFEREADRIGLVTMEGAGFDEHGMASFFERLQRAMRLYETNAPAYLHTHPLTSERIADIENRIKDHPYHQVPDSQEFQFVRGKLRALQGNPREAVADLEVAVRERPKDIGLRFGYAHALLSARQFDAAEAQLRQLRAQAAPSAMLDNLAASLRMEAGDAEGAARIYRAALARAPHERALVYGLHGALMATRKPDAALALVKDEMGAGQQDYRLYGMLAKSYAALGKNSAQHRALGEMYAQQGLYEAAIEQLQLAQKAADSDFYEMSAIDARLRELKAKHAEERKDKRGR
ncbi:MAG: M48 family metallopeptidase [Rhodocyclaceae bacterium]|nr:M48 family metallopeptidase [Rhodocyclaceae bacterium]